MNYDPEKKPSFSAAFCRISGVIIFFSFLVFFQSAGFATWQKVAQFPATVNSSFFFNEQRGFVAMDGYNGIKRTSDGGKTWKDCITPSPSIYYGNITDIFMRDSLNGWAGIENDNLSNGLWFTNDGGVSWQANASITGQFSSVYQPPSGILVADRWGSNKLSLSIDGGATFTRVAGDKYTGINFVDDLHGVATTYIGTAVFTNDGGLSWKPTSAITTEAWSVYALKGTSTFVIAGERNVQDASQTESIFSSNDYGATWQTIGTLFGRTTGHIAGVGSVIYTQSWTKWQFPNSSGFIGLNRSTDGGATWKNVGGPANYRDTRFSVIGCNGSVVYAFDENGGVWKTTDGGDGIMHEAPNLNPDQINLFTGSCKPVSAGLTYSNFSCNALKIESISFSDSTLPIVSTGALSFSRYPKLPQILSPSLADSLILNWDPKKLGAHKLAKTFIKVHGSIINSNFVFDTVLAVSTESFGIQPDTHPDSLVFPVTRIGEQICSTFVLKNSASKGNSPFILETAGFTNNDTTYKIISVSTALPASVAGQDSLTLEVCFSPLDSSHHLDSLILKTDCFSFGILLDGKGLSQAAVKFFEAPNSFSIYPNPTQNELTIHVISEVGKETEIEIFDALGKKVLAEKRYLLNGMTVIHLNTKNLSSGIYLVRLGETSQNFIKEK